MKPWLAFGLLMVTVFFALGINACTDNDTAPRPTEFRVITGEPAVENLQATINAYQTREAEQATVAVLPTNTPLAHPIAQGMVIGGDAVIFAEPRMDAIERGNLPVNTPLDILAETEPNRIGLVFYNIQYEGINGWIANTQVQLITQSAIPTEAAQVNTPRPTTPTRTLTPFPTATATFTPSPTLTATALPPGFPTPEVYSLVLAEQVFESGRMIWFQPLRQVWVLKGDQLDPTSGTWSCHLDSFVEGEPERDPNFDPPAGVTTASRWEGAVPMQPIRGFGKIWRESPGVRENLGWAITPETLYTTRYEYTAGGTMAGGQYTPAPGEYRIESLYQYTLVFTEASVRAPCENKTGQWHIE